MKKNTLLVVGFALFVLAALVYTTLGNAEQRCEVCITYKGRTQCRIAAARTREQAQRTASDLACATLTGSMAERMTCPNTPPDSVTWK